MLGGVFTFILDRGPWKHSTAIVNLRMWILKVTLKLLVRSPSYLKIYLVMVLTNHIQYNMIWTYLPELKQKDRNLHTQIIHNKLLLRFEVIQFVFMGDSLIFSKDAINVEAFYVAFVLVQVRYSTLNCSLAFCIQGTLTS